MKQLMKLGLAAAAGAVAAGSIVYAQAPASTPEAVVSLYRAAPGHQEMLLKWLARQDQVAQAAGIAPAQLYIHVDGDSWDYMTIRPATTDAQDMAFDAAATQMGVPTGPRLSIDLRKHVASHTDTFTVGPITAAQAVASLGG